MDIKNNPLQHLIVGIFSLFLVFIFNLLLDVQWSTSFARVSFILLFLILIIGPIMRLKKPTKSSSPFTTPWSWRGELGIWFTLMAITHFIIIVVNRPLSDLIKIGGGGFSLANFIGFIALILSVLLAITSFKKLISFLGISSWKWLHGFTYVIFYLVSAHFIYFQFFSTYGEIGPDWFGYLAIILAGLIILLQFAAFALAVKKYTPEKSV